MQQESVFYKGRMSWLNEIQLFRKDLQRLKCEVDFLEKETDIKKITDQQVLEFRASIKQIDFDLDSTEKSILYSLNNGRNYWLDAYGNNVNPIATVRIENDLFEKMKTCYSSLIDLLRLINNVYLREHIIV